MWAIDGIGARNWRIVATARLVLAALRIGGIGAAAAVLARQSAGLRYFARRPGLLGRIMEDAA